MKKAFIYLSLFLLSSPLFAVQCNLGGNQAEMNQCAHNDFLQADRELNKTYKALIRKSAGNRGYIRALRKSQRVWMKFRDAELNAIFYCAEKDIRRCWGSIIGVLYPSAKEDLTRDRTKQLKKYLEKSEY